MNRDELLRLPMWSLQDWRAFFDCQDSERSTRRFLLTLGERFPGLLYQSTPGAKLWIMVPVLLQAMPTLARAFHLTSEEYERLRDDIEEIKRELHFLT